MQGYINYKSNREAVVKRLLLDYLNSYLNYVLINSVEGGQTARQIAMHNAIENAHELLNELKLTYNHVRQNVITTKLLKYLAVPVCELIVRAADEARSAKRGASQCAIIRRIIPWKVVACVIIEEFADTRI